MSYYLKQITSETSCQPIEISLTSNVNLIGGKRISSLSKYKQVSDDHAMFFKSDDGSLFVKDLNSQNGLFVNDARVRSHSKRLDLGDLIGFGVTTSSVAEGFVCVLRTDASTEEIKLEVIDLSDGDCDSNKDVESDCNSSAVGAQSDEYQPSRKSISKKDAMNIDASAIRRKRVREKAEKNPKIVLDQPMKDNAKVSGPNLPTKNGANPQEQDAAMTTTATNPPIESKALTAQSNSSVLKEAIIQKSSRKSDSGHSKLENNNCNNAPLEIKSIQKPSSVKIRPEKFCFRMGFLTEELGGSRHKNKDSTVIKSIDQDCKSHSSAHARELGETSKSSQIENKEMSTAVLNKSPQKHTILLNVGETLPSKPNELQKCKLKELTLLVSDVAQGIASTSVTSDDARSCDISHLEISFNSAVKKIISLDTKCLQEHYLTGKPPSVLTVGVSKLPLSYKSFEFYASSLYPMLILEIWELLVRESTTHVHDEEFHFSIISCTLKDDGMELKCETVINEKFCTAPREGIMTELKVKSGDTVEPFSLFGYVFKHKSETFDLSWLKNSLWNDLPAERLANAKRWKFYVYVSKPDMTFKLGIIMSGRGICYVRSKLRLADSLYSVKHSPLLTDILQPRISTFLTKFPAASPTVQYSARQMEIIKGICDVVNNPSLEPKIVLCHGPAGTGKTHVILGIIEKLFFGGKSKPNLKILITSPSDVVVDDIGCRLIDLNEMYGYRDNDIKFVRVGIEKLILPEMMPFSVDTKAKELYHLNLESSKRREREIKNLSAEIFELEKGKLTADRRDRLKYLTNRLTLLQNQAPVPNLDINSDMAYKVEILKDSEIVLSTLSKCGMSCMLKTFKSNSGTSFSCCIVDDSTQCTELEILQPLMFGIDKLILIGDQKQLLPTVHSKISAHCGLGRSLFERFRAYFKSAGQECPVVALNEQFRMQPSICQFPSVNIYNKKLITHHNTAKRSEEFPLYPYIFLKFSSEGTVLREELIVCHICRFLLDLFATHYLSFTIGVITGSQEQRSACMQILYANPRFKDAVRINTVDAYQGKEEDVIILSSLKAENYPEGLRFLNCRHQFNVAITRARKCLIVCGEGASLMKFPEWKALMEDARERKHLLEVKADTDISLALNNCKKRKYL